MFESNGPAAIKCMCSGRWKCRVDATCLPHNQVNKVKIGTVVTPILARAQATFALTHTHPSPPWIYALSIGIGLRTPNICQFTYPKFPFIPTIINLSSSIHPWRKKAERNAQNQVYRPFGRSVQPPLEPPWRSFHGLFFRSEQFERIKVYTPRMIFTTPKSLQNPVWLLLYHVSRKMEMVYCTSTFVVTIYLGPRTNVDDAVHYYRQKRADLILECICFLSIDRYKYKAHQNNAKECFSRLSIFVIYEELPLSNHRYVARTPEKLCVVFQQTTLILIFSTVQINKNWKEHTYFQNSQAQIER